jgi:hypothetical protein
MVCDCWSSAPFHNLINVVADIDSLPLMLALARNGAVATINSRAVSMVASAIVRAYTPTFLVNVPVVAWAQAISGRTTKESGSARYPAVW